MVRMLSATAIVASLMITPAAPTLAAAPSSQCLHAQNAIKQLLAAATHSQGALRQAYLRMARSEQDALKYYC